MKKVILVPDSFKGTMSSADICKIMAEEIRNFFPAVQIISIPVADGGEGTVDCFLAAVGGNKIFVETKGPYMEEFKTYYGLLPDGTSVIEMASCAGLSLVENNRSAGLTTTYGVGVMISHAIHAGCKKIIIGLGGSATNDGGTGAAMALGVNFLNKNGESFMPTGANLQQITHIDMSNLLPEIVRGEIEITAMCDIDNPLCGEQGAAHIFGPQKGANSYEIDELDKGLLNMAGVINCEMNIDILNVPGSGAAGGMGGGMMAFLGAKLETGIDVMLNAANFDKQVVDADMVFSGEGRLDTQTLRGKVILGIARRTKRAGVPLIAIVGDISDDIDKIYDEGVTSVLSINNMAIPFCEAKLRSREDLRHTMNNLIRYTRCIEQFRFRSLNP